MSTNTQKQEEIKIFDEQDVGDPIPFGFSISQLWLYMEMLDAKRKACILDAETFCSFLYIREFEKEITEQINLSIFRAATRSKKTAVFKISGAGALLNAVRKSLYYVGYSFKEKKLEFDTAQFTVNLQEYIQGIADEKTEPISPEIRTAMAIIDDMTPEEISQYLSKNGLNKIKK